MRLTFAAAACATALWSNVVSAAGNPGQIVQITSASNWCMMMPPMEGGDIAANEDRAIAFCTTPDSNAPGAKIFPGGFIQSAHFASGDGYVQVTGQIDRTKYGLAESDSGGQYDIKAPVGSACAGYNHYVNLIEPHINVYCIRCCHEKMTCNTGKSTYGCATVIPGDYSGPSEVPPSELTSTAATIPASVSNTPSNVQVATTATLTTTVAVAATVSVTPVASSSASASVSASTTSVNPSTTQVPNAAIAKGPSQGVVSIAAAAVAIVITLFN